MSYHRSKSTYLKKCLRKFSLLALAFAFVFAASSCDNTKAISYVGETIDINELFARSFETAEAEAEKTTAETIFAETEAESITNALPNETEKAQTETEKAETNETPGAEVSSVTNETNASSEAKDDTDRIQSTVYWVENGKVWHKTKGCSALSRSKNIMSGSKSEAAAAGKERECKKCY